jgi:hypothetical protein
VELELAVLAAAGIAVGHIVVLAAAEEHILPAAAVDAAR